MAQMVLIIIIIIIIIIITRYFVCTRYGDSYGSSWHRRLKHRFIDMGFLCI